MVGIFFLIDLYNTFVSISLANENFFFMICYVDKLSRIKCNQLLPTFLSRDHNHSEIWNNELVFERNKKYLIRAISGAGKTTLVRMLIAHNKDYQGSLSYDEHIAKELSDIQISQLRASNLSTVFQKLEMFDELSGFENIKYFSTSNDSEIFDMAQLLGVESCLEKQCAQLSQGQKQRLAIIRALARDFDFLLLDEPFSNLDPVNISKASNLILETTKKRKAGLLLFSLGEDYGIAFDEKLEL